jgi:cytidylate kinase
MDNQQPLAISISRLLGSGGMYIGQQLAKRLNILYLDREISGQAAKEFMLLEEDLEAVDEKVNFFWKTFIQRLITNKPYVYAPPAPQIPSARLLFDTEAAIIRRMSKEQSAVFVGRCATHILRDHPKHLSILLHSDLAFRIKRIQQLYNLTEEEAKKQINETDVARREHYLQFTGYDMTEATGYDLTINTGRLGIDASVEFILKYIQLKFGITA